MNRKNYKRLGDYIRLVDVRNRDLAVTNLLGVSISKTFIPSIANTIGTDMSTYKIVEPYQFAYGPVTSRNGDKITFALYKGEEKCIVSSAYVTFEVIEKEKLDPDYLMMWALRPEFDRYARFMSNGSAREMFSWDDMCEVYLPIPDIDEQRRIVAEYQAVEKRISTNEALIAKLEETAQTIYKKMFVDDIDPENLPNGWRIGHLSDIACYIKEKMDTDGLTTETYISTENMLKNRGGISEANSVPAGKCTSFSAGNILVSNIRPYFKKIWLATFNGGCSNDVLCFSAKGEFQPEYVYGAIVKDEFFDYVMAGSNGVKMPRGDKEWIMKYPVCVPSKVILEDYNNKAKTIIAYQNALIAENASLVALKQLIGSSISQQ